MSNTLIGASVEIEYKSIKDLKAALEGTEKQFKEMVDTFGEGSEQAQQAQKKLLSLQDGVNKKTEEYNDKVDAAAGSVSALNATVGGLQGALELTGLASEETEKALAKVTAALSVGDAVQNLAEFGPMIKTTFKTIKDSGVAAFKALRTAIGSTGIGLLVIALGVIVAYWDDIKAAVTGVTGEMKKLNIEAQEKASKSKEEYDQVSRIEESLKRQGYTERDILKLKILKAKVAAEDAKRELQLNSDRLEAQKLMAERNQKILAGIIKWLNAPLVLISMQVDRILKLVGLAKYAKLEESIDKGTEFAASFVFDPKDFEKKNEELKVKAQETQATLDGHLNQLQAMDDAAAKERAAKAKAAADKRRADNEKRQAEEQKLREAALAAQSKAEEDLLKSRMTAREIELFDLQKGYLEQKKTIQAGGKSTLALTQLYNKQKADILKKYRDEELAKEKEYQERLQDIIAETENASMTEAEIARQAVIKKYKDKREEEEKQNTLTFTMNLALRNAEQAELDKIDEDERQKKLKKDEARFQKDAANADLSFKERIAALQGQRKLANELEFESEDERKDYIEQTEKEITALRKAEKDKQIADLNQLADLTLGVLSTIKQANDTDINIKKEQYNQDVANLQQMLDNKQISQEQFEARRKELDAQQNEELKKSFKRNQVMSIAEAIINTAKGVTNALATLPPPFSFIQAAATAVLGGLQVKMISKQKPEQLSAISPIASVGGGGGGTAPIEAGMSAALQGQALNAEAINALGNNAMRAYVLNSDIQNNSQRNAYLQRNARIG